MERVELAEAAAVLGALAAPLLLLARHRLVLLAGVVLVAAAEIGLAFALVPDQLRDLVGSPARLAAAAAGLVAVAGLAAAFARWPAAIPVALLAAAPIRLPVEVGGEEAFLLLPLYAVLAASVLALLLRVLRGAELQTLPLLVATPAAAFVLIAGLSLLWSRDPREGAIDLFFFLFPFAVLLLVVGQALLTGVLTRLLAAVLLAVTVLIAAIGLWQQWTHTLFFADDLQFANAYTSFFRVTSIFSDSSVYGRYLAVGIAVTLVVLWLGRLRPAIGLPVVALLFAGLYFSYSQSSFAALFAGVLLVGLVAGDRRARLVLAATAAAVVLAAVALFAVVTWDESSRRASSGRLPLVEVTVPVFADHPLAGVGIGAQPRASSRLDEARERVRRNVSHTTPLTVAAELGLLGLAAYAGFLFGAARSSFLALSRDRGLGLSLLAVFTILVAHSLAYSGFFEDPLTWGALGLAGAALRLRPVEAAAGNVVAGRPADTSGDGRPTREADAAASRGASA